MQLADRIEGAHCTVVNVIDLQLHAVLDSVPIEHREHFGYPVAGNLILRREFVQSLQIGLAGAGSQEQHRETLLAPANIVPSRLAGGCVVAPDSQQIVANLEPDSQRLADLSGADLAGEIERPH